MKLLLDESVPRRLAGPFPAPFTVRTVQEMGWAGTGNRGIEHQQNPDALPALRLNLLWSENNFDLECTGRFGMMRDMDQEISNYVDLPDDPELAFAILQQRQYAVFESALKSNEDAGWKHEQRYVDTLIAFDEVHDLGILTSYRDKLKEINNFNNFFHEFCRYAEMASIKIRMENARRLKIGVQTIIVLGAEERKAIHILINAIKEKLNELTLSDSKRESLFNKLNVFAAEVDRDRTRPEAFFAFAIDATRGLKKINDELKLVQKPMDRVLDLIEKAEKWTDMLPSWRDRQRIEGPPKKLTPPQDLDEEIPF